MRIDPTNHDLTLALIDQMVAGKYQGRQIAYTAVTGEGGKCRLAIAEFGHSGYTPISGWECDSFLEAFDVADGMNLHIGLSEDRADTIIASSMRAGRRK